jgi:hypothetical protein
MVAPFPRAIKLTRGSAWPSFASKTIGRERDERQPELLAQEVCTRAIVEGNRLETDGDRDFAGRCVRIRTQAIAELKNMPTKYPFKRINFSAGNANAFPAAAAHTLSPGWFWIEISGASERVRRTIFLKELNVNSIVEFSARTADVKY